MSGENLALLSSAIGMMEQWSDGIMGSDLRLVYPAARREYWNGGFRESKQI
jgi:hypothetical protein